MSDIYRFCLRFSLSWRCLDQRIFWTNTMPMNRFLEIFDNLCLISNLDTIVNYLRSNSPSFCSTFCKLLLKPGNCQRYASSTCERRLLRLYIIVKN